MRPTLTAALTALTILTAPAWAQEESELDQPRVLAREGWPVVRNGAAVAEPTVDAVQTLGWTGRQAGGRSWPCCRKIFR